MAIDGKGNIIFHQLFDERGLRIFEGNFNENGYFAKIFQKFNLTENVVITTSKSVKRSLSEQLTIAINTYKQFTRTISTDVLLSIDRTLESTREILTPVSITINLIKGRALVLLESVNITQSVGNIKATMNKNEIVSISINSYKSFSRTILTPIVITQSLLIRRIVRLLETLTISQSILRRAILTKLESIHITDTKSFKWQKIFNEAVTISIVMNKQFKVILTELYTIGVSTSRTITRTFTTSIKIVDTLAKSIIFVMKYLSSRAVCATRMKQYDLYPIETQLLYDDGTPINVSGATVAFSLWKDEATSPTVDSQACTMVDATNGKIKYQWKTPETSSTGMYRMEYLITFVSGETISVPSGDVTWLFIIPSLNIPVVTP